MRTILIVDGSPPFYPLFLHMMTGDIPNCSFFEDSRFRASLRKFRVASLNPLPSPPSLPLFLFYAMQFSATLSQFVITVLALFAALPFLPRLYRHVPARCRPRSTAYLRSTALMHGKLDSLLGPVHKHDVG